MTTEQPQPSPGEQPSDASSPGNRWTPPLDAPPPFPQTGSPSPFGVVAPNPKPPVPTADERTWAMLAHLSSAIAWVLSAGWLNFVGPLIVWVLYKDRSRFVRNASAGAFNFTLSMTIVGIVGWILTITVIFAIIGIPLILISGIGAIVLGIVGAVKTWNGEAYTYPWQLKVLD